MATTFTNISTAQIDDMVVDALRSILPMFSMISARMESEPLTTNMTKRVPFGTDPSVVTKTAGTFATTSGALTGVDVTPSTFEAAAWDAKEGELSASLLPKYWASMIAGGAYGLAKSVIDAALANVTGTNFGNVEGTSKLTVAVADFGAGDLGQLRTIANKRFHSRCKALLLNSDYAGAIMSDSAILGAFAQSGTNLLATGKLPTLNGWLTAEYDSLPDNSESLGGIAFGPAAIAALVGPPDQLMASGQGNIVERRTITEPDSGLSVLYTVKADAGGTLSGEMSVLYGTAVGRATDAVRLVYA